MDRDDEEDERRSGPLLEGLRWCILVAIVAAASYSSLQPSQSPPKPQPAIGPRIVEAVVLMRKSGSVFLSVPDPKSPQYPFDAMAWSGPDANHSCLWTKGIEEMRDAHRGKKAEYRCEKKRVQVRGR